MGTSLRVASQCHLRVGARPQAHCGVSNELELLTCGSEHLRFVLVLQTEVLNGLRTHAQNGDSKLTVAMRVVGR